MPSEFAGGRVKLAAFSGTCNLGSAVAVPVQSCEGWPVAEQLTVYGVPEKIDPLPLMCQPSRIPLPIRLFITLRAIPGRSYPKLKLMACGRLTTFLVRFALTNCNSA